MRIHIDEERIQKMFDNKKTGEGLDAMMKMLPHMEAIIQSEDFAKLKERMKNNKELTFSDIMGDAFTVIAMKNRAALYGIVGAAMDKTPEEVAAQPLEDTLNAFRGVVGSRTLDFFIFCARMVARL